MSPLFPTTADQTPISWQSPRTAMSCAALRSLFTGIMYASQFSLQHHSTLVVMNAKGCVARVPRYV